MIATIKIHNNIMVTGVGYCLTLVNNTNSFVVMMIMMIPNYVCITIMSM